MAVNLTVFPLDVSGWGATVNYSTDITVGKNGQEVRNANWQDALRSYNAAFNVKTAADIATLNAFFLGAYGREQAFLVKDWSDFKVTAIAPSGLINSSNVTFQIVKTYIESVFGTITRTITKPKTGTISITDNGVTVNPANYSVNLSTGVITFSAAPTTGHTILVTCEFYVPCRFDVDSLPVQQLLYVIGNDRTLADIPEIPLVEVRE